MAWSGLVCGHRPSRKLEGEGVFLSSFRVHLLLLGSVVCPHPARLPLQVVCRRNSEREALVTLMQKALDMRQQGRDLAIKSAFAHDHLSVRASRACPFSTGPLRVTELARQAVADASSTAGCGHSQDNHV